DVEPEGVFGRGEQVRQRQVREVADGAQFPREPAETEPGVLAEVVAAALRGVVGGRQVFERFDDARRLDVLPARGLSRRGLAALRASVAGEFFRPPAEDLEVLRADP